MPAILLNAYAIFVNNQHISTFFVPSERDEWSVKMTAALKSDPTIVFDAETDIEGTCRYSVYVDGEYVDKLYQNVEPEYFYSINSGLQNNPKIIWIETDYDVNPNMSWSYIDNYFVRNE